MDNEILARNQLQRRRHESKRTRRDHRYYSWLWFARTYDRRKFSRPPSTGSEPRNDLRDSTTRNIVDSRSDYAHVEHVADARRRLMKFYGNGYWPSRLTRIGNMGPGIKLRKAWTTFDELILRKDMLEFVRAGK